MPDGSRFDPNDEDAVARAATAPTAEEIADRGPPPAPDPSDDDLPGWAK
jgi:hypothetical protein